MVKKIICILLFINISLADIIEIDAKSFFADEKKGESVLSGDVLIKSGKDTLKTDKLFLYTDKNRKPLKIIAKENVNFQIFLDDKIYNGKSKSLSYDVIKDIYEMNGNAIIIEKKENKKLYGDTIIIDRKNNTYLVKSDKKPSRFIFEIDRK